MRNASIWTLGQIISLASASSPRPFTLHDLQQTGGVISVNFVYECYFDGGNQNCLPQVVFSRIDDPSSKSAGFNYRRANMYRDANGILVRDLVKLIGIRFTFQTTGFGKKFTSIVPAFTQLGAGIGLLAVATLVADLLVEYVLPRKRHYAEAKIQQVEDLDSESRPLLVQTE